MNDHRSDHRRLWVSSHEGGWEAWVAQHDDLTFSAWACRRLGNAVSLYIEDCYEHATAAAEFSLRRLSDHEVCGPKCKGWEERALPASGTSDQGSSYMAKRTGATKGAAKKTGAAKRDSQKRERINTGTDVRYVKRNTRGEFKESDDVGRSMKADRAKKAKTTVKPGYGDQGDQKPRARKKAR